MNAVVGVRVVSHEMVEIGKNFIACSSKPQKGGNCLEFYVLR